jgi:hypothetical protein
MKIFFYIAAGIYPLLVFFFLLVLKIPLRSFSIFVIMAGFAYFLLATRGAKGGGAGGMDGVGVDPSKKKRVFPGGSF